MRLCALLALALSTPRWLRLRSATTELRRDGQTAAPAADPKAQALFEFLMARRMEAAGDTAGALAALERARKLDPASAEIAAEIAGNYSRQDRMAEAAVAGEQALKLDKDNIEAHHVLALVYSAWADGAAPPPSGQTIGSARTRAIEHLTAIQGTPLVATNPNLQMTLGRLQLRAGKADVAVPILEKVAQQVPWAAEPLVLLYEAQTTLGRIDEAGADAPRRGTDQPALLVDPRPVLRTPGQVGGSGVGVCRGRGGNASSRAATCRFAMPRR